MKTERNEWWLFGVMAVLIVAVVAVAWWDVPELSPVAVTYSTTTAADTATTTAADSRIDLNTATVEELTRLSGLGEKTAEKIIAYRDSHGGFDRVEELLNIDGIGEGKLAAWEPYLTV